MFNPLVLDLSHHNKIASFQMIFDYGVRGVILKATQGSGYVDPTYAKRKLAAKAAGLAVGAYHFASSGPPDAQLKHFLDVAELEADEIGALDYEPDLKNGDMKFSDARDFLANYESQMGRKATLYSGHLLKEKLGTKSDPFLGQHKLWLAQYSARAKLPPGFDRYFLWQYSDGTSNPTGWNNHVAGVQGLVDCNHYEGTAEQLLAEWN